MFRRQIKSTLAHRSKGWRFFSDKKQIFDAEVAAAYNKMAENHKHPRGPWKMMTDEVAKNVGSKNATVLDLASGPGQPAASIAAQLTNAEVIATDFSEDMVAAAAKTHKDVKNLTVQWADAQDLNAFTDNSFDVVTCCYGYMFPEDKYKALQETLRVLKPNGKITLPTYIGTCDITFVRFTYIYRTSTYLIRYDHRYHVGSC